MESTLNRPVGLLSSSSSGIGKKPDIVSCSRSPIFLCRYLLFWSRRLFLSVAFASRVENGTALGRLGFIPHGGARRHPLYLVRASALDRNHPLRPLTSALSSNERAVDTLPPIESDALTLARPSSSISSLKFDRLFQ